MSLPQSSASIWLKPALVLALKGGKAFDKIFIIIAIKKRLTNPVFFCSLDEDEEDDDEDDDDEDEEEPRPGPSSSSSSSGGISQVQVESAVDITEKFIEERLTPRLATEIVMRSMHALPSDIPPQFHNTYTPIAAAGTEGQVKHVSRYVDIASKYRVICDSNLIEDHSSAAVKCWDCSGFFFVLQRCISIHILLIPMIPI